MTPETTSETVDGMNLGKIAASSARSAMSDTDGLRCGARISRRREDRTCAPGPPFLVRQAAARSNRASSWRRTTSRSSPTVPTASALAAGATPPRRDLSPVARDGVVHRGRHHRLFRVLGPFDHQIDPGAKIRDGRFLRLIDGLLQAGYLEDWRYHATLSGCPQGGVASPVLSNIYLDRLDKFIEQTLPPAYNRGARRTPYRPYMRLWQRACRLEQQGEREAGLALRKQMKTMPSRDPDDPGYRRLRYCRYADDWLLAFTGPRQEAEQIKACIGQFLHDQLKLELSPAKTLITHGRTQAARFLGYEIVVSARRPQARSARSPQHQRGDRAESTGRRDPREVRALPAPRQTDPANRTHRRYRLQYRRAVPGRVPGCRGVLPAGVQPSPARTAEVRHGTVADQDPGPQVPDQGPAGLPPLPCRPRHRARSAPWPSGHRAPRWRAAAAGGAMGRHLPGAGHHTTASQRQSPAHLEQPPVRTRSAAPGRHLRTMRIGEPGRGAPYPCPQRPQPQGKGTPARMGHADGRAPPQDPCRLPRLPRGHPCRTSARRPR